jgi:hypothetical protein
MKSDDVLGTTDHPQAWLLSGAVEAVPRHSEIADRLARKICRGLSIPEIGL